MEDGVDAVTDVSADDTAASGLGVRLNGIAELAEQRAGLNQLNGLLQTFTRRFSDADRVWVSLGPVAHIVCFVEVAVVPFVVQCNVEVYDIAVEQDALVGYPVADDFVHRSADGFGEVVVVEG